MDTVYKSSRIYCGEGREFAGGILFSPVDGKVKSVFRSNNELDSFLQDNAEVKVIDFEDRVIIPGLVDSHVHVNEPGRTQWEGFQTATRAAATGGFTTICDMPLNSIPATTTLNNLNVKIASAEGKCFVDVAFWGGVVPGNDTELQSMIERGVVGFKCFLCPSGVPEFEQVVEADVDKALDVIEKSQSLLAFHAEIESGPCSCTGNPISYETYLNSRPKEMELNAIELVIRQAEKHSDAKTHIVHLSTGDALPMIIRGKVRAPKLTVETCHHYLTLKSEDIPNCHTEFKSAPPIRDEVNRQKLWIGLSEGFIEMVVSDHSPSTADMKHLTEDDPDKGDFLKAWGGVSSVQFGLSLFWTECQNHGLGVKDLVRLMSSSPAKLCGLDDRKGLIKEGFDADFCIWEPDSSVLIDADSIQFRNKISPYIGREFKGKVYQTTLRGQTIYKAEEGVCANAKGKLLIN